MTDLVIVQFGDTWVREDQPSADKYGSTSRVHVLAGTGTQRLGLLLPTLPNIAGRTVLSATLVGYAAEDLTNANYSVAPATERWSPGSVNYSTRPVVDAGAIVTVATSGVSLGETVEWDVTSHIQAVADGSPWYGWRLSTTATSDQMFNAYDSGEASWELHLTLSDVPSQPDELRPDGGGNISDSTPILSWTFFDAGLGSTAQAQSRVQVDTPVGGADPDEVSPDYDSTMTANIEPEWDLTGEHTLVGAGPHYWRVMVADGDGNQSEWSDWAEFGVATKPNLVIDAPTGAIGDPSPTLLAHLSSGSVASWTAWVTGPDRSDIRVRSGNRTGVIDWQIPLRGPDQRRVLLDDVQGWIYLRVYPSGNWTSAVGQPPFVEEWISVLWDADAGIVAPTDLTVVPLAEGDPRHVWTFEITDVPEAYLFIVDGKTVARVGADDITPTAGVVTYTDEGLIPPLRSHTLQVRAVSDSGRSAAASVAGYSHTVSGVWLLPEDTTIEPVQLAGTGVGGFSRQDFRATYVTSTGDEVDIIYGKPSRSGQFDGMVDARDGEAKLWAAVDSIEALRSARQRFATLVWGSQSARVRLRDPDVTAADDILPGTLTHRVSFGFVEVPD